MIAMLLLLLLCCCLLLRWTLQGGERLDGRARRPALPATHRFHPPKPPWVVSEVLRLKALMPRNGCRKIAATFGHLHQRRGVSVSKSYVAEVLRKEGHRLAEVRKQIRRRRPRSLPKNLIWGLDLTQIRGQQALGVIDHGTRACLAFRHLKTKASIAILRALLDAIELYGKLRSVRTDNEAVFTSRLFRFGLCILGIRHQRSAPFAPWQNGRIERLFGTFKKVWWMHDSQGTALQEDLDLFRFWYNHARPHQNLDGRTPAMAWSGAELCRGRSWFFEAWDGLLAGYVVPT